MEYKSFHMRLTRSLHYSNYSFKTVLETPSYINIR